MAQLTVWECDKCYAQVIGPHMPEKWKMLREMLGPQDVFPSSSYLWCDRCWERIRTPIPKDIREKI